jgi:hypothetical protein
MKKLGFVLAAAVLFASSPAYAFTTIQHRYVFYDQAEGSIVGYLEVYCDNTTLQTGRLTAFYDEEHFDC